MSLVYFKEDVESAAEGKWLEIFAVLAPAFDPRLFERPTKHVTCPVHGSRGKKGDGFRFYKTVAQKGDGICNSCGGRTNGFSMLMWVNKWEFLETLNAVGDYLRVDKREWTPSNKNTSQASRKVKALQTPRRSEKVYKESKPVSAVPLAPVSTVSCTAEDYLAATEGEVLGVIDSCADSQVDTSTCSNSEEAPKVVPIQQASVNLDKIRRTQANLAKAIARDKAYQAKLPGEIKALWQKSFSLKSVVAEPMRLYLKKRGLVFKSSLNIDQADLRFIPNLEYYEERVNERTGEVYPVKTGEFPAILAGIHDVQGRLVTLHRIYITRKGKKAPVDDPKKMKSVPEKLEVTGAAIRLGDPIDGVVGVAEGIETALAAYRGSMLPTWSTVNATLLANFDPPEGTKAVVIFADKDVSKAGEVAANELISRMREKGIVAFSYLPEAPIPKRKKSIDWNDVLLSEGMAGFPSLTEIMATVNAFLDH